MNLMFNSTAEIKISFDLTVNKQTGRMIIVYSVNAGGSLLEYHCCELTEEAFILLLNYLGTKASRYICHFS